MTCAKAAVVLLSLLPALTLAEMQALDDSTLSEMSGQGGVYLSGEFSINKNGGVLWETPTTNNPAQWTANQRSCATLRLSLRALSSLVLLPLYSVSHQ